jgi:hypothetical protein
MRFRGLIGPILSILYSYPHHIVLSINYVEVIVVSVEMGIGDTSSPTYPDIWG